MRSTETLRSFSLQNKEATLSYLMIARSMMLADPIEAKRRLGLSDRSAEALLKMTPAELMRLAPASR